MVARDEIVTRFIAELTRVVGAVLETNASSRPAATPAEAGFAVSIAAAEGDYGTLLVFFAAGGTQALAKKLSTPAVEPAKGDPLGTLREICGQAATALADKSAGGVRLAVASVQPASAPADAAAQAFDIVMARHEEVLHVALSGDLEFPDGASERPARSRTLDVILDIDLPLVVRFGRTEMPLKALTALGPGSVIDLGRSPDEPVDVLISNQVVARGEVVIVAGNYGVRIQDVVSPSERARSLEVELP